MIIKDCSLADTGLKKIRWAKAYMPVLQIIEKEFAKNQPFAGVKITTSVHLEAKTACLALALQTGGAEVHATGCNPLSTQDDVAAGLASLGVNVYATHNCSQEEYTHQLSEALSCHPDIFLDDGGDLAELLHGKSAVYGDNIIGGTEETTTGVHRLKARHAASALKFPMLAVNDAQMKHLFDNRYGTGQSTLAAILNTTNIQMTGKTVVVAGYGWCGRGIAARALGMGARVIVTEIDPVKAIEANMDGFQVMTMDNAALYGDFFITVTGCKDVITRRHFDKMKDGAILCNAGHFDVEIDAADLRRYAEEIIDRRLGIQGFKQKDGRILNLLAEGRLVNLAAGDGHPVEIMDMSFSVQALALRYILENGRYLQPGVYDIPVEIDSQVALLKLKSMGLTIDVLTPEQTEYLNTY